MRSLLDGHPVIAYTLARLAIFAGALAALSLVGLSGVALLIAALLVSGLLSAWLLVRQRDVMSDALAGRLTRIRAGLDEGAASEDEEYAEDDDSGATRAAGTAEPAYDEQRAERRTPPMSAHGKEAP